MPEQNERPPVVHGVDPALAGIEDFLVYDAADLAAGGLADANMTIMGIAFVVGGETRIREAKDGQPPDTWITKDQLRLSLRVDNWEELGLEDENASQFLSLPKAINVNGQVKRAISTKNDAYGMWLIHWDKLGVSSNPEIATEVQITAGLTDFIGLHFRRQMLEFDGFGNRGKYTSYLPTELFGYDNDARAAATDSKGQPLAPKYTRSQQQAMNTAPAAPANIASRRQAAAANA